MGSLKTNQAPDHAVKLSVWLNIKALTLIGFSMAKINPITGLAPWVRLIRITHPKKKRKKVSAAKTG